MAAPGNRLPYTESTNGDAPWCTKHADVRSEVRSERSSGGGACADVADV